MSTDIKLSKAQISKTIQSGGFLGPLLSKLAGPLSSGLANFFLLPSGITAAVSAIDAGIQKNTRFCDKNLNSFKQRNEWHNENCSSSLRF